MEAGAEPTFFELGCNQRAHRALLQDPIPDDVIERILEARNAGAGDGFLEKDFPIRAGLTSRAMLDVGNRMKWLGGAGGVFLLLQLVPVDRGNPPIDLAMPAPREIQTILERSCYDCHSNETNWPWYGCIPSAGSGLHGLLI